MLLSELKAATIETLTAELARLESGNNQGGPLVGPNYANTRHAVNSIRAELAKRSEPSTVSAKPSESITTSLPDAATVYATRAAACRPTVQAEPAGGEDDQAAYPTGIDAQQIYAARRYNQSLENLCYSKAQTARAN